MNIKFSAFALLVCLGKQREDAAVPFLDVRDDDGHDQHVGAQQSHLNFLSKALTGLVWWWALTRPNAEKAFCGFPGGESAFARVEQVEDLFEDSPHVTQS